MTLSPSLATCSVAINTTLPLVCIGSLFSFLCGVGIGANDLSANFAMVVGSGSLNMRRAILYCSLFELLGAAFMGGHVSSTIRGGIVNPLLFTFNRDVVVMGMTCASFSAALWLYLSTVFGLPVSITHTVIGSILGFAIFATGGFSMVQGRGLAVIVASWVTAPVAACIVTALLFFYLRKHVFLAPGRSFEAALAVLPYALAASLLVDVVFVMIDQPPLLTQTFARYLPLWLQYILLVLGVVGFCWASALWVFPRLADSARTATFFVWESRALRTEAEAAGGAPMDASLTSHPSITSIVPIPAGAGEGCARRTLSPPPEAAAGPVTNSSMFLAALVPVNSRVIHQPSVRLAPVAGRSEAILTQCESMDVSLATELDPTRAPLLHASSPSPPYGTMPAVLVDDGAMPSPAVLRFNDPDWNLDHPMEPIRFGNLLVKPFNPRAEMLFTGLQVVAGSMSSFVHGAVAGANATAAFTILYDAFTNHELGTQGLSARWSVAPAMLGIAIGMFGLGSSLMKTVGMELVTVTPARGWCIQVGGTFVTMLLTGVGIPVSLSQSQVGAAIGCGLLDARSQGVSWRLVGQIVGGWVVTLIISATTTGICLWVLSYALC